MLTKEIAGYLISMFSEAFPAVNGSSFRRLERNFRFLTTVGTSYLVHFPAISITHLIHLPLSRLIQ